MDGDRKVTACPCNECVDRKMYAEMFDHRIWGEDCPYACDEYENWKKQEEKHGKRE